MRQFTKPEIEAMISLYTGGKSLGATATELNRSLYGIYYRLKKSGIRIRSRSESMLGQKRPNQRPRKPHSIESRRKMSVIARSRGASHNWYVDGNGKDRTTARKQSMDRFEYRMWREAVFSRDAYKCQICGIGGDLHADHINAWSTHPDLRYDVSNGRTLCVSCHQKTPTYGGRI